MAILLGASDSAAARIGFALSESIHETNGLHELDSALARWPEEDLVIIGQDVEMTTALAIAARYQVDLPQVGVVLLRDRIDVDVLQKSIRAGIREVIEAEDTTGLIEAATRARQAARPSLIGGGSAKSRGKIILVFAAKGGCGKTTISTNLGAALARDTENSVCLVDFDLEFGDVAVALQMEPRITISDAVPIASTIDTKALESLVTPRRQNFDVLFAPRLPADAAYISADLAQQTLTLLSSMYGYVVVDSPPAFTEVILRAFDLADSVILVTTLDMPAVKNLQVTLNSLDTLGYDREKCRVVINRSTVRSGLTVQDVEEYLGIQVAGTLPSSTAVSTAINRGLTMVEENAKHPFSKALREIAADAVGIPKQPQSRKFFRRSK